MREQQEVTYKLLYSSSHLRRHFSNPFEKCSIIKRLQNPRECEWMRGEQPKQGIFIVNVIHLRKIFCNKTILVSFNGSINPILNLEDPYKTNLRFYQRKIKLYGSYSTLYKKLVESLDYLIVTRPNISYNFLQVRQFLCTPQSTHNVVVLRILDTLSALPQIEGQLLVIVFFLIPL